MLKCDFYVKQGYKERDAFIMTQAPLPDTVIDFWTMIYDHSCRAIVMMNDIDATDKVAALSSVIHVKRLSYQRVMSIVILDFTLESIFVLSS